MIAALGRRRPALRAKITPHDRQQLFTMPLRDGRVRLIQADGSTFLLCASVAAQLQSVFSR